MYSILELGLRDPPGVFVPYVGEVDERKDPSTNNTPDEKSSADSSFAETITIANNSASSIIVPDNNMSTHPALNQQLSRFSRALDQLPWDQLLGKRQRLDGSPPPTYDYPIGPIEQKQKVDDIQPMDEV